VKQVLSTHQLTVGYLQKGAPNVVLKDLSLSLQSGELVCFMGPNGIGKSTLIRTLASLQSPLSGSVSAVRASDLAVVLTDRISTTHMTVEELIAFGRYPYLSWSTRLSKDDAVVVRHAMAMARVTHLVGKKLYELSDGQMQLVMIARALAQQTPVIILDEPTAHLDLNNRLEVMNVLRNLTRTENKAVLVATHELDLALQTADLIWLATPHKTIVQGIPEELVLNGAVDDVFQFKGFDLKTGKVQHPVYQKRKITLQGTGFEFLWTKNALERNGYQIDQEGDLEISVRDGYWHLGETKVTSIANLLIALNSFHT